jgi:hypothetical protein
LILAVAVAFLAVSGTRAQEFSNVFTFAPAPAGDITELPRGDINKLNARAELQFRPNTATEVYMWVLNPLGNDDEFTVEMRDTTDTVVARKKVTIPVNTWKRVRLDKVAPPAPATPPAPAPATPPAAAPQPAPEPPPPGVELPRATPRLTFRLLDKNGKELKDKDGRVYGNSIPVKLFDPSEYVETPVAKVTPGKGTLTLTATVKQREFPYPGSAAIQLNIPPQPALKDAFIRDGVYRRMLTLNTRPFSDANPAPSVSLVGVIENMGQKARVYVGVDGIDRAFAYTLNPLGLTPATQLLPQTRPAVRVSRVAVPDVTQPVGRYPVLIEVDNPSPDDRLELRVGPVGKGLDVTERIKLDTLRDVRVWLDTAGPTDGGLLFTTRSRDWVKPLDLSHLRGKFEVTGVIETKERFIHSEPIVITVDATPPERITLLPVPATVEKGKPLVVSATVNDPDTTVTKATFFLAKELAEDGKIPPDAIKAVGAQSEKNPALWTGSLKVPDDFRGPAFVGVVFANQAGLSNDPPRVQKVEIVDAKAPGGTVEVTVTYGERPQAGAAVSVRGEDGKEKAGGTTDAKGKVTLKVPVGSYSVVVFKKDSSTGAAGNAPVQVDLEHTPEKPAKVTVTLSKVRM